jgi:hypothetical protein
MEKQLDTLMYEMYHAWIKLNSQKKIMYQYLINFFPQYRYCGTL